MAPEVLEKQRGEVCWSPGDRLDQRDFHASAPPGQGLAVCVLLVPHSEDVLGSDAVENLAGLAVDQFEVLARGQGQGQLPGSEEVDRARSWRA